MAIYLGILSSSMCQYLGSPLCHMKDRLASVQPWARQAAPALGTTFLKERGCHTKSYWAQAVLNRGGRSQAAHITRKYFKLAGEVVLGRWYSGWNLNNEQDWVWQRRVEEHMRQRDWHEQRPELKEHSWHSQGRWGLGGRVWQKRRSGAGSFRVSRA